MTGEQTLETWAQQFERERAERAKNAKEAAAGLFDKLAAAGIGSFQIRFDGSGDSGTIEGCYADEDSYDPISLGDLQEPVEDWAYEVLEGTNVDWYNNEGGYGHINMNVPERKYEFEVYYRVEESHLGAMGEVTV